MTRQDESLLFFSASDKAITAVAVDNADVDNSPAQQPLLLRSFSSSAVIRSQAEFKDLISAETTYSSKPTSTQSENVDHIVKVANRYLFSRKSLSGSLFQLTFLRRSAMFTILRTLEFQFRSTQPTTKDHNATTQLSASVNHLFFIQRHR
jgi:hypothetical protein